MKGSISSSSRETKVHLTSSWTISEPNTISLIKSSGERTPLGLFIDVRKMMVLPKKLSSKNTKLGWISITDNKECNHFLPFYTIKPAALSKTEPWFKRLMIEHKSMDWTEKGPVKKFMSKYYRQVTIKPIIVCFHSDQLSTVRDLCVA